MLESENNLLTGVRVLIVDDDPDARELFSYMLTTHGAFVHAVESAEAALDILETSRFDVVTIDGALPSRDGWSLLASIRQAPQQQGGLIPAVAITAFAYPEDVARSLAAGFQAHLSKPVSLNELVTTIATLLGSSDDQAAGA